MIEEWDKLWEDKPDTLGDYIISDWGFEQWINRMERAGDKLIERVEYLDGLTDGDVKLITKLQVENGELKHSIATGYCGECDILKILWLKYGLWVISSENELSILKGSPMAM